jgi:biotin transporter BioY
MLVIRPEVVWPSGLGLGAAWLHFGLRFPLSTAFRQGGVPSLAGDAVRLTAAVGLFRGRRRRAHLAFP